MSVQSYIDSEFGEIAIHRIKTARHIKIGLHVNGQLRATMPPRTPKILLRKLVDDSRPSIRTLLEKNTSKRLYQHGDAIGKTHSLLVTKGSQFTVKRQGNTIVVTAPAVDDISHPRVQQAIRKEVIKALRKEAKAYLPQRLALLAKRLDCSYEKVRLSHASTRWGSCSSSGTISLNIALMKLPFSLIDYVIIHELCHTKELNHSDRFWRLVEQADPEYKKHVAIMKTHSPTI